MRHGGAGLAQLQQSIHAGVHAATAETAAAGARRCMPLHVHGQPWILSCDDIGKVVVLGKISPVPGAPHCIRGVIAVSGVLYTLIDLGRLVYGEATRLTIKSRAVCLTNRTPGANMAVLVDRALDIVNLTGSAPANHNDTLDGVARELAADVVEFDGRRVPRLDAQRLFETAAGLCGVDGAIFAAA